MPRAAQRHVVHQSSCPRTEPQHLDGFGTQECDAGGIGFHAGEMTAQVCAYLVQNHSAGTGTVRFAPESASKTTSFVVSKANSTDCPMAAFDSAETLATKWFSRTSPSASSSSS